MESVHIHLDQTLLADTATELGLPVTGPPTDFLLGRSEEVAAGCRAVEWGLRHSAPALYADAAAQVLAVHLLLCGRASRPPRRAGLTAATLASVVAYLHEHLATDVTLDELSAVARVSKFHFLRQFSVSVGQTPHRFLTELRLERARVLLRASDQAVRSVAAACGYASASRFSAAFTRRHGMTPGEYRKDR